MQLRVMIKDVMELEVQVNYLYVETLQMVVVQVFGNVMGYKQILQQRIHR